MSALPKSITDRFALNERERERERERVGGGKGDGRIIKSWKFHSKNKTYPFLLPSPRIIIIIIIIKRRRVRRRRRPRRKGRKYIIKKDKSSSRVFTEMFFCLLFGIWRTNGQQEMALIEGEEEEGKNEIYILN